MYGCGRRGRSCCVCKAETEKCIPHVPRFRTCDSRTYEIVVRAGIGGPASSKQPQAAVVFGFVCYAERLNAVLSLEEEGEFTCDLSF